MGGMWLHEDRPLSSYDLKSQDFLEFRGKTRTVKVLVDETQTIVPLGIEYSTTVERVIQTIADQLKLKQDRYDYAIRDAGADNRTYDSYKPLWTQMGPHSSLMLKRGAKKEKKKDKEKTKQSGPAVFGVPLAQVLTNAMAHSGQSEIPAIVQKCFDHVVKNGMDTEGIFRLSGGMSEIQALKLRFDRGENVDLNSVRDPHVVTGLLKLYLREMPEPVITYELYDFFLAANGLFKISPETRQRIFQNLLSYLPEPHYHLLDRILAFMRILLGKREHNKMTTANLAMMLAPNIMRKYGEDMLGIISDAGSINSVTKTLIEDPSLFQPVDKTNWVLIGRGVEEPALPGNTREDAIPVHAGDAVFILGSAEQDIWHGWCRGKNGTFRVECVEILNYRNPLFDELLHSQNLPSKMATGRRDVRQFGSFKEGFSESAGNHTSALENDPQFLNDLDACEAQVGNMLDSIITRYEAEVAMRAELETQVEQLKQQLEEEQQHRKILEAKLDEMGVSVPLLLTDISRSKKAT
eukprot:TRINITY_DN16539_c0_g1_i1.p1 TRINITY_DN16539_c0_g1~~TRINITY_DN16539_c0_g1_i1.p1  ORF type:complete len:587 (-),score=130.60 TRINITY_DN16539_c0_g1_i1:76-1641(-)